MTTSRMGCGRGFAQTSVHNWIQLQGVTRVSFNMNRSHMAKNARRTSVPPGGLADKVRALHTEGNEISQSQPMNALETSLRSELFEKDREKDRVRTSYSFSHSPVLPVDLSYSIKYSHCKPSLFKGHLYPLSRSWRMRRRCWI